ncbi:MAG: hypothetical protein L6R40_008083 [Gallowayella cf. fulva]|nr:MAG: hypothetical protein L6R40_008083 [Xanthomendoza cf. fulva]
MRRVFATANDTPRIKVTREQRPTLIFNPTNTSPELSTSDIDPQFPSAGTVMKFSVDGVFVLSVIFGTAIEKTALQFVYKSYFMPEAIDRI